MSVLSRRTLGELNVSLPTSLALEGLYEKSSEIRDYTSFYFNIRTLLRNIVISLERDAERVITSEALVSSTVEEIEQIESIFREVFPKLHLYFYYNDNSELLKQSPDEVILRTPRTLNQKFFHSLYEKALEETFLYYKGSNADLTYLSSMRASVPVNAIILSSVFPDIVTAKNFRNILLLESNTGALKDRSQWYTKFPNKIPSYIPPNKQMLFVFGDNDLFRPQLSRYRSALLDIAKQYNWNSITTYDRMKLTVGYIKDPEIRSHLLKLIVP